MHVNVLHTCTCMKQLLYNWRCSFFGLGLCVSYDWRIMTLKWSPNVQHGLSSTCTASRITSFGRFTHTCNYTRGYTVTLMIWVCLQYRLAKISRQLAVNVAVCAEKSDYHFVFEDRLVQQRTPLRVYAANTSSITKEASFLPKSANQLEPTSYGRILTPLFHYFVCKYTCIGTVFSLLHARASIFSVWVTYPTLNRNWRIFMYWSPPPRSDQQRPMNMHMVVSKPTTAM